MATPEMTAEWIWTQLFGQPWSNVTCASWCSRIPAPAPAPALASTPTPTPALPPAISKATEATPATALADASSHPQSMVLLPALTFACSLIECRAVATPFETKRYMEASWKRDAWDTDTSHGIAAIVHGLRCAVGAALLHGSAVTVQRVVLAASVVVSPEVLVLGDANAPAAPLIMHGTKPTTSTNILDAVLRVYETNDTATAGFVSPADVCPPSAANIVTLLDNLPPQCAAAMAAAVLTSARMQRLAAADGCREYALVLRILRGVATGALDSDCTDGTPGSHSHAA